MNTNNLISQAHDLTHGQPWWVVLLFLLIILILAVGWAADKVTKALTKFTEAKAETQNIITFISSLLKARSRAIVFLLWVIAGLLLFFEWESNHPLTRTACLRMTIFGGFFFLFKAYLIVDIWIFLVFRKHDREQPALLENDAKSSSPSSNRRPHEV